MAPKSRAGQLLTSWFEQNYEYRVEEGDLRYAPSKIEAVRRDGEDFDDVHLANLKRRLKSTAFPISSFVIYLEIDEFRRFVRIYIDLAHHSQIKKKGDKIHHWSIVTKDEIQSRILNAM